MTAQGVVHHPPQQIFTWLKWFRKYSKWVVFSVDIFHMVNYVKPVDKPTNMVTVWSVDNNACSTWSSIDLDFDFLNYFD